MKWHASGMNLYLVDENKCYQGGEVFLGESSDVADKCASINSNQNDQNQADPEACPESEA